MEAVVALVVGWHGADGSFKNCQLEGLFARGRAAYTSGAGASAGASVIMLKSSYRELDKASQESELLEQPTDIRGPHALNDLIRFS